MAALDDVGACPAGDLGGKISTIISNDQDAVMQAELGTEAGQGRQQAGFLVVGGYQHRYARTWTRRLGGRAHWQRGQQHLGKQHQHRHEYDAKQYKKHERKQRRQNYLSWK
jgi:hypothetical protein